MALGKIWHLHRVYLCQSPYFATMFNGSWKEAKENFIKIKITDPKITLDCKYINDYFIFKQQQKKNTLMPNVCFLSYKFIFVFYWN